jgi:2'-5' RNA ligase
MLNFKSWLFTEDKSHSYSCVMANFPNPFNFIHWSEKNIKQANRYMPEGGIDKTPHVTILYGLHTIDHKEVSEIVENVKPFEVSLGKISKFESEKYDVLKIEVKGSELSRLNQMLKKLPYTSKYKEYIPHCTLAYVEKNSCNHLLNNRQFDGKIIKVKQLVFSPSNGEKTKINLNNV